MCPERVRALSSIRRRQSRLADNWLTVASNYYPPYPHEAVLRTTMSNHTYTLNELVGSSHAGIEHAIENAITKAASEIKNLRWLEVKEIRGHIEAGKVAHWQVRIKIGATHED